MHSGPDDLSVGLPHSEIPGSKLGYQLPWAFRRFLRPSSPLDAKTSTVCPFTLGHVDRMPSDRLASDRRSPSDTHAGPSCVWTGDLPHSPRRRVLQAASQANSRSVLAIESRQRDAGPARASARPINHRTHALFTEPVAFAAAPHQAQRAKCRVEEFSEIWGAVKGLEGHNSAIPTPGRRPGPWAALTLLAT